MLIIVPPDPRPLSLPASCSLGSFLCGKLRTQLRTVPAIGNLGPLAYDPYSKQKTPGDVEIFRKEISLGTECLNGPNLWPVSREVGHLVDTYRQAKKKCRSRRVLLLLS